MGGFNGSRKAGVRTSLLGATALCTLALAIVVARALAAAGGLDGSFSGDGKRTFGFANGTNPDNGNAVAIQRDGKIVVAGDSLQSGGYRFAVARLNPNGGLDGGFSGDGRRTFAFVPEGPLDSANAIAIQPDGRIVVAGYSDQGDTGEDFAVARLKPNGDLDFTFSGDGRRTFGFANGTSFDNVNDVGIQPDGKIVVAGRTFQSGTTTDFAVARLKPNGQLDTTFSGDGRRFFGFANGPETDTGSAVAIQGDGKIVVAGHSVQSSTGFDIAVARLNPNGVLDTSFSGDGRRSFGFANGPGFDFGHDVAIQGGGRIVVAGYSDQNGTGEDFAVARLKPNGGLDNSFSDDGKRTFGFANTSNADNGFDVAIQRDGRIVVAGRSTQSGTGFDIAVARLNPDGFLDFTFSGDGRRTFGFANGTGNDSGNGVAIQANGRIVVAGTSPQSGAGTNFAVARLLGG